jgi:N-acetylmuramoyl-L-alanine amidase
MKYIISCLAIFFFFVVMSPTSAHAAEAPAPQVPSLQDNGIATATVNFDKLRLRRGPSFNSSSLGALPLGTIVDVFGKSPNGYWIKVSSPVGVGWLARPYITMTASLNALPIVYVDDPFVHVTAAPSANGRRGPSTEYPVDKQLPPGTEGTVDGKNGQPAWYKVTLPDGTTVWVRKDTVELLGQAAQIPTTLAAPLAYINTYRLNVRTAPSLDAGIIGQVGLGQLFIIVGITPEGRWYQIQGKFGTGWVKASFVRVIGSLASVTPSKSRLE